MIIELYRFCEEEEFPIINSYHSSKVNIEVYNLDEINTDTAISASVCVSESEKTPCDTSDDKHNNIDKHLTVSIRSDKQISDITSNSQIVEYIEHFVSVVNTIDFSILVK